MKPYYEDGTVTLWHGDCREVTAWLEADVLVCDPPYGIAWSKGAWSAMHNPAGRTGIQNDGDTLVRDAILALWAPRPALVFGSLRAEYPTGWKRMLVFRKPLVGSGLFGNRLPWLTNWEPVFVCGDWPEETPTRDAVVTTSAACASGYSGYTTRYGHSHAKPLDAMEALIEACPPGIVADPCAGSGSTLLAARAQGRRAIGVEVEERYCEMIAKRLSQGDLFGGAA